MGSRKRVTDCAINMPPIKVYYLVASGKLARFPAGFLDRETCKEILRHLVLNDLKMSREEICANINQSFLQQYYAGGFRKKFDNNIAKLITYCFPEMDIRPWELGKVEFFYWHNTTNQKNFVTWIAQKEKLDLNSLSDVQKINVHLIAKYHGSKARVAAGGTFELINAATGGKFQEWEILKVDNWTEDKAKKAIKWLIEEKLEWTEDEQIYNGLTAAIFRANHLGGLLKLLCNNSPLAAINIAYPGRFVSLKHSPKHQVS